MIPEERTEYVKYRIEKAYQTYEAAKVLSENGKVVHVDPNKYLK